MLLSNLFLHLQKAVRIGVSETLGKTRGKRTCRTLSTAHCRRTTITIAITVDYDYFKIPETIVFRVTLDSWTKTNQFCGQLASFTQNSFNLTIIKPFINLPLRKKKRGM